MISFALFSALITFYFTMFVTPGPNNSMLTASGIKFGFVRTLPHLLGIPLGHILQIGLCCYGLANIFFLYLLYLSTQMIGSFDLTQKETGRPLKFYEASIFQFINPKAWSIALTVAAGFFPSEENFFIGILFVTLTAAIVCFPSICLWALFGEGLRKFVKNVKSKKIIEYILALLLVLSGVFILIK